MTRRASRTIKPRWQTPLPPGVTDSWGPAVGRYVTANLGVSLDRWQQRAVNRALAVWPDGTLVHRIYLVSTGRQNGKTLLVRAVIGWALTFAVGPPWQTVSGFAHDRRQAGIPYRRVLEDLRPIARRVGPVGRGGLALTRYLGIRSAMHGLPLREYHVFSREAADAARGESVDLGVFDEVRTQRSYDTWAAIEPTTRARPEALILPISTAGDDRSILLRDMFDRGVRIIDGLEPADGFGMTWYAGPDGADLEAPHDDAILAANPAVAEGRVQLGPVRASIRTLTPATYLSETLNLWTDGSDEWLPAGTWKRQEAPQPAGPSERVVLGVEVTPSWSRATVTVAMLQGDGAWCGVAAELDTSRDPEGPAALAPETVAELLEATAQAWRPAAIAYSGSAAMAPYARRVAEVLRIPAVELGGRQLRQASELLRSELVGGRLMHGPDALLAHQVRAARPSASPDGGDWYLSIRLSVGDVDGIRAVAWAAWAAIAPPEVTQPAQVFL